MTPKTAALLIRLTPEDRRRLDQLAAAQYLETSTWARQVLLGAADALELQATDQARASRAPSRRRGG